MRAVRRTNTKPELAARQTLHSLGLRFRLHRKDLPGTPDIVLPKFRTVIFVHGCFWHRHTGCRLTTTPKSNYEFWQRKFEANIERDKRNEAQLEELGWRTLVVWECETQCLTTLRHRLVQAFLAQDNFEHEPGDSRL
ncbi:very short patch repair endonuclease [Chitinimonas koreensis]|nr:DNA mismatch endonuclease Vsr [Chitinimonas koreensis]